MRHQPKFQYTCTIIQQTRFYQRYRYTASIKPRRDADIIRGNFRFQSLSLFNLWLHGEKTGATALPPAPLVITAMMSTSMSEGSIYSTCMIDYIFERKLWLCYCILTTTDTPPYKIKVSNEYYNLYHMFTFLTLYRYLARSSYKRAAFRLGMAIESTEQDDSLCKYIITKFLSTASVRKFCTCKTNAPPPSPSPHQPGIGGNNHNCDLIPLVNYLSLEHVIWSDQVA